MDQDTPGEHFARAALRGSVRLNRLEGVPPPEMEAEMSYEGQERRSGTDRRENGIKFDKTINLGHVLTMAAMIAAVMGSWSLMDKRVVVLEVSREAQRERDSIQDVVAKEKFQEVRDALVDIKRSVEKVSDKVGAR